MSTSNVFSRDKILWLQFKMGCYGDFVSCQLPEFPSLQESGLGLATSEFCKRFGRWKWNSRKIYIQMAGIWSDACSSLMLSGICWLTLLAWGRSQVPPATAQSPWGNCLAYSSSKSLAKFMYNFLWQVHQLFLRVPASWKSGSCRQWHTNVSPSEKQMCSTLSLWVSAHPYLPTLHIHLSTPNAGISEFRTNNRLLN